MKIITLNTWGGRAGEDLILSFFEKYKDTDIFCLQEIYNNSNRVLVEDRGDMLNIFSDIQKILPKHVGYFRPVIEGYGLALFAKKDIQILEERDTVIHTNSEYVRGASHQRNQQYIHFIYDGKEYTVHNVHGLWNGMGKTDTDERLLQSAAIKKVVDSAKGFQILCGDFNLLPDTQSVAILEKGMRNLITEYGVTCTRTKFYTKPEKFADYIFISPEIKVKQFKVLSDAVSDHAALFLEI